MAYRRLWLREGPCRLAVCVPLDRALVNRWPMVNNEAHLPPPYALRND